MSEVAIQLESLRHRFESVVEEAAEVILRTSNSVFAKETADFGACLVTVDGEVFAAPRGISANLMIGLAARAAVQAVPDWAEGDIMLSNDPEGTQGLVTHLPDFFAWQPIFHEGELLAFAMAFVHVSDIGGALPGSISWRNQDIVAEGLRLPPVRYERAGHPDPTIRAIIAANSRMPEHVLGDLDAIAAGVRMMTRRMGQVIDRYGAATCRHAITALLDLAERRARRVIGEISDGRYEFADYLDPYGEGELPVRIRLTMTVSGDQITLDFTGTAPQAHWALNIPTYGQAGHNVIVLGLVNYLLSRDPSVPYNAGLVRPIQLELPAGTIVNPDRRAPCGVRAAAQFRIIDCVYACLAQAGAPDVPAASSGAVAIALIAYTDPATGVERVEVAQPLTGGSGARPGADGLDGTSYVGGWLRNVPNELLEQELPVLIEHYGYAYGSGGAGTHRGGHGMTFRLRAVAPVRLIVRGLDRLQFSPWGLAGGAPGRPGRTTRNPGQPDAADLGRIDEVRLTAGEVVEIHTAGGGGWGPGPGGGAGTGPGFTLGPAREEFNRRHPEHRLDQFITDASRLPANQRYAALQKRAADA